MNLTFILKTPRHTDATSTGLLVLRVVTGLAFMLHGWGKIQSPMSWMGPNAPVPGVFQALAAISEFCGGAAWILGLLVPVASAGMICTMAVAVFTHAVIKKDPFVGQEGSYELAAVYLCVSFLLLLSGPGKLSLDRRIFGERSA